MSDDERDRFEVGKEHFRSGREKSREKMKRGTRAGREQLAKHREKLEYYNENRQELIEDLTDKFSDTKGPAITGTIVVGPILVTYIVIYWLINKIKNIPGHEFLSLTPYTIVNDFFKLGFAILSLSIIVTGVGRFVMTDKGFKVEKFLDSLIGRIPVVSSIHNLTKVSLDTLFTGAEEFRSSVKIDFDGLRLTGFRTGNQTQDGRDLIFIPTAPNITSGFVVEMDQERFEESDESVEETLTKILSAGFADNTTQEEEELDEEDFEDE